MVTTVYKVHKRLDGHPDYGVETKMRPTLEQARLALAGMLRQDMTTAGVALGAYGHPTYLATVLDDYGCALFAAASVTDVWPEVEVSAHRFVYTLEVITD